MRILSSLAIVAMAASSLAALPAAARDRDGYNDRRNARERYEDCRDDKKKDGRKGIAIGAIAGGAGTALLGGGVGESLVGAAVGGTAGNFIGRGKPGSCSDGRGRRYNSNRR